MVLLLCFGPCPRVTSDPSRGCLSNTEHLGLSRDLPSFQACLGDPFSLTPTSTDSHTGMGGPVPGADGLVAFVRIPSVGASDLHTSGHSSTTTEHLDHLILLNFGLLMHKMGLNNGPFTWQPLFFPTYYKRWMAQGRSMKSVMPNCLGMVKSCFCS